MDPFTPPGSPKPKKLRPSLAAHKVDEIDIDAIIKAPIVAKSQKGNFEKSKFLNLKQIIYIINFISGYSTTPNKIKSRRSG